MRAPAKALILFGCCCSAVGGCARSVTVAVGPGLLDRWKELVSVHPLPGGYRWAVSGGEQVGAAAALALETRHWSEPPSPAGSRVLEVVTLAATVPLSSGVDGLSSAEIGAGSALRLEPLDSVALPERLVAIDGAYPGAASYPLRDEICIRVVGDDPRLLEWLDALPGPPSPGPMISWLAAVGDLMLDRGVDELLIEQGAEAIFGDTLPVLRSAGILIGNLESSVTRRGTPQAKAYTFRADPRALKGLVQAGFTFLSVANNHSFDYGMDGFVDTLENLRASGIGTSGAGADLEEALRPFGTLLGTDGVRIWALAAYPVELTGFDGRTSTRADSTRAGVLWADRDGLGAICGRLSAKGTQETLDVVAVHGGQEWESVPSASQMALYRALVDSGADIVLGSHPHVLQGMEARGGSLIVFSLGNFVFPGMEGMTGGVDSIVLLLGIYRARVVAVRIVPVRLQGRTVRISGDSRSRDRVLALSRALAGAPP